MRFNKASVQLCLLSTEQNIYSVIWLMIAYSNWNVQVVNGRAERTEEPLFQPVAKKGRVVQ